MISHQAIDEFLSRKLKTYGWIKRLTKQDLQEEVDYLLVSKGLDDFEFKTDPFTHQLATFMIGAKLSSFLFYLDMGAGKSFLSLALFAYRKSLRQADKALVVVPNVTNIEGWRDQVNQHSDFEFVSLAGTKKQRVAALKTEGDVYVINYQGLRSLLTGRGKLSAKEQKKKKKKTQAIFLQDMIDKFADKFDFVVLDEIQFCKNRNSQTFEVVERMTQDTPFLYGLTGTPMNKPLDLWSQFYLVDGGSTLGESFELFLETFYIKVENPFGSEWQVDHRMERDLRRMLRNRSIRYEESEMNDIPRNMMVPVHLGLTPKLDEHYENIVKGFIDAGGEIKELKSTYNKLRQICSGYLRYADEVTDEDVYIDFPNNPKMEALESLIDSMPDTSKMVIFNQFTHTGELICSMLQSRKLSHRRLWSGTKDKSEALRTFTDNPKCRFFVVNHKSGGTGLNLQVANYLVYFETPTDPIVRRQSLKRVSRTGQTQVTYTYDLIMRGRIDDRIQENLKEGMDLVSRLIDGHSAKRVTSKKDLIGLFY